jgi:hypothetical protein
MKRFGLVVVRTLVVEYKDSHITVNLDCRIAFPWKEENLSGESSAGLIVHIEAFTGLPQAQTSQSGISCRRGWDLRFLPIEHTAAGASRKEYDN